MGETEAFLTDSHARIQPDPIPDQRMADGDMRPDLAKSPDLDPAPDMRIRPDAASRPDLHPLLDRCERADFGRGMDRSLSVDIGRRMDARADRRGRIEQRRNTRPPLIGRRHDHRDSRDRNTALHPGRHQHHPGLRRIERVRIFRTDHEADVAGLRQLQRRNPRQHPRRVRCGAIRNPRNLRQHYAVCSARRTAGPRRPDRRPSPDAGSERQTHQIG